MGLSLLNNLGVFRITQYRSTEHGISIFRYRISDAQLLPLSFKPTLLPYTIPASAQPDMAPIVHLVRHAQGYHNLEPIDTTIPDPSLTPLGREQATALHTTFPHHSSTELLITSPLRRTILTTVLGFHSNIKNGTPVIAFPDAQETSAEPCDTGSDVETLQKEFAGTGIDFSLLTSGWNKKHGKYSDTEEAVAERARLTRQWLRARPEKEVVLVTHGGFLHYFTEDWSDINRSVGTGWANTEFRSYIFKDGEENASVVETPESRASRRGREHALFSSEKRALDETVGGDTAA